MTRKRIVSHSMVDPIRLHHPSGPDSVAWVSVEPATAPGMVLVRVARGAAGGGTSYGPYPEAGVDDAFKLAVDALIQEGFEIATAGWDLIKALGPGVAKARARAALRIAWRQKLDAVPALRTAASEALDAKRAEVGVLVEALGLLGDQEAIPLARALAARKNLARRRSGVEALRCLGDVEGLQEARLRALGRLPDALKEKLEQTPLEENQVPELVDLAISGDPRRAGLHADILYELGTSTTMAAARRILSQVEIGKPHIWRYAKSVLKRAMIRRDAKTFGWLAHYVDVARGPGAVATVKSGLDGKKRQTRIRGPKTIQYLRRACARHLRDLARWQPEQYAQHAAETLVHYRQSDAGTAKGRHGAFARCLILGQILRANDPRVERAYDRWRSTGHGVVVARPEAFPALWRAEPGPLLRVLRGARLPMVFDFGMRVLEEDLTLIDRAELSDVIRLADADPALAAASHLHTHVAAALTRRIDAERPYGPTALAAESPARRVLTMLCARRLPAMFELFLAGWIKACASSWVRTEPMVFQLPMAVSGAVRRSVVEAMVEELRADDALRADVAPGFLALLRGEEPEPGRYSGFAAIARDALLDELHDQLDLDALLRWLDQGSASGRSVAGSLLGKRDDGLEVLGRDRVVAMCDDEVRAVRASAHAVVLGALERLKTDPSLLFALAESRWDDTRDLAFDALRELDWQVLGLDGLIGLCDSNDADVELLGRELVSQHFEALDPEQVLYRLSEHPRRTMQRFALGLIETHLRPGLVPISRLESYFRAVLFDTWPSRPLKFGVLDFLAERGAKDVGQAEFAVQLLSDVLHTQTRGDFERVVETMTRLGVQHGVNTPLTPVAALAESAS